MNTTFEEHIDDREAKALFILLDARDRIGALFPTWDEIEEIGSEDGYGPIADAYRQLGEAIEKLGGPPIQAIYEIKQNVLAALPVGIDDEVAIASAILHHCAVVTAR